VIAALPGSAVCDTRTRGVSAYFCIRLTSTAQETRKREVDEHLLWRYILCIGIKSGDAIASPLLYQVDEHSSGDSQAVYIIITYLFL
jgi:hypothetical protein